MKHISIFLLLLFIFLNADCKVPLVLMRNCIFRNEDGSNYIETQFSVMHSSLHFRRNSKQLWQGAYNVNLTYTNAADKIIQELNYNLLTSEISDTNNYKFDLLDLKRLVVPSGIYRVSLMLEDKNSDDSVKVSQVETVGVYFPENQVSISSPIFIQSYTPTIEPSNLSRMGYDIIPYTINYFTSFISHLIFYQEIYQLKKVIGEGNFKIKYRILDQQQMPIHGYEFEMQVLSSNLNYIFSTIDISDLPSGTYHFNTLVLDSNDLIVARYDEFFLRSLLQDFNYDAISTIEVKNKFVAKLNSDSLFYWLQSLEPIANQNEFNQINIIMKDKDTLKARKFFFLFWNQNAKGSEENSWLYYNQQVDKVDYQFSTTVKCGYETDRGRIFLQYGAPSERIVSASEPAAYPYEIWKYYKIENGQTNVVFVFCDLNLGAADYKLIHSDARGELHDTRWKYRIYDTFKNQQGGNDIDNSKIGDHLGGSLEDLDIK